MDKFTEISSENSRKLKYLGFCSKCKKSTFHRFHGGSIYVIKYRCIKCKTVNERNSY